MVAPLFFRIVPVFMKNRWATMVAHKLELLELLEFPRFFAILPGKPLGIVGIVGIPDVFYDSTRGPTGIVGFLDLSLVF